MYMYGHAGTIFVPALLHSIVNNSFSNYNVYTCLMRDEGREEERSKQGQADNMAKQTEHPIARQSHVHVHIIYIIVIYIYRPCLCCVA